MSVKLIVFDIAGTTVQDTGAIAIAFQNAMSAYDYNIPIEEINPLMGYKKPQAIQMMLEKHTSQANIAKVTDSFVDEIHSRFLKEMIEYYKNTNELEPLPHAEELFQELHKRNIKVALDTGFSHDITAVIVDRLEWVKNGLVDFTVSSDEVKAGRPHPYMIQKAMEKFSIHNSKEVIKLGDTEVDINEGKNANCLLSIAMTTGAFTRTELEPYSPDFILDDLFELLPIIEKHL